MENIITSNYDTIRAQIDTNKTKDNVAFKSTLNNVNNQNTKYKDFEATYQNITNMTPQEIEDYFGSQQVQQEVRNKYLATQFSSDPNLSLTMFNYVDDLPYEQSTSFLANMFTQKNIYLNNINNLSKIGTLLRQSIIDQIEDPKLKDQQAKLEKEFTETMMRFEVMDYFNDMLDFGKSEYEKNKDSHLSSLYDNFYNQYSSIFSNYKDTKEKNDMLIQSYIKG